VSPEVAILVLNYNGKTFLEECFNSLEKQTYLARDVYLVDNASVDGSVDYVRMRFPWVRIIAFEKNHGYGGAYNRAVAEIKAPYVLFLNNDIVADERWLETLVSAMESDQEAVAAGGKILFYAHRNVINSAGIKISPVGIGYDVGFGERDRGQYDLKRYVAGVCGASMLVRTGAFREVDGFDEDYFLYGEDVDLCWRFLLQGYRIVYEPHSVLYHHFGGSAGGRESPLRVRSMQRNMICNAVKNFQFMSLVQAFAIIFAYSLARFLSFLVTGKFKLAQALMRGSLEPRALLALMPRRRKIQSRRILSDRQLGAEGFIASFAELVREYLRISHRVSSKGSEGA